MALIYFSGQGLVRVGVVDPGCRDVVDLLVRAGLRLRDVDDLQDLGTAGAGDLNGTHARVARSWSLATTAVGDAASVIEWLSR
jgi:hypothetical protein